jgi:hypothetical protein
MVRREGAVKEEGVVTKSEQLHVVHNKPSPAPALYATHGSARLALQDGAFGLFGIRNKPRRKYFSRS